MSEDEHVEQCFAVAKNAMRHNQEANSWVSDWENFIYYYYLLLQQHFCYFTDTLIRTEDISH